jgi:dTDP-4-dehydrorhamnose reductase
MVETTGHRRYPKCDSLEEKVTTLKILVTGASGLLGTKLCQIALRKNHSVHAAYSQHKPSFGTPFELNILDQTALQQSFKRIQPEAVVHSAALTDVDKCEIDKELASKTNFEATANLANLCNKFGAFLVYVSTDYVFNGEKGMYSEKDPTDPINHYGITKLKGEEAVQTLDNYCIARGSIIYGSTSATGKTNFALWLLEKLRKKEEAKTVTDQWNSPTLNVNMAEMIVEAVEKRKTGIFHMSGASRLSRIEFAQNLAETFNLDTKYIIPVQSNQMKWVAKRPRDSSLNVEKAEQILTYKPRRIREALEEMKKEIA